MFLHYCTFSSSTMSSLTLPLINKIIVNLPSPKWEEALRPELLPWLVLLHWPGSCEGGAAWARSCEGGAAWPCPWIMSEDIGYCNLPDTNLNKQNKFSYYLPRKKNKTAFSTLQSFLFFLFEGRGGVVGRRVRNEFYYYDLWRSSALKNYEFNLI